MSRASAARKSSQAAALTMLAATACAGATACAPAEASELTLSVYAASSLAEAFADLERDFEAEHPGIDVVVVHGGSADLAASISEGAPADVFASAHERHMDETGDGQAGEPRTFATNTLTMIVERGNPLGLSTLADLEGPDVVSVVCAPRVPCGDATARLTALSNVSLSPSSEEGSVTDVLGKVASGQADAGIVYATDVARSDNVEEVPLPYALQVQNTYPIAPLRHGSAPGPAKDFIEMVTAPHGQAILASHGFGPP